MKIELMKKQEFDVCFVQVKASVRYWEDSEINGAPDEKGDLTPCRNGDNWEPLIDIQGGFIYGWPSGTKASIHFKVCDAGLYQLLDSNNNVIAEKDGYVPIFMCPKENGYGDYIIMDISEYGNIEGWKFSFDPEYWQGEQD